VLRMRLQDTQVCIRRQAPAKHAAHLDVPAVLCTPHEGSRAYGCDSGERDACWEAWIEATVSQRIEWAVNLFRRQ
jgi:hypothetical protein